MNRRSFLFLPLTLAGFAFFIAVSLAAEEPKPGGNPPYGELLEDPGGKLDIEAVRNRKDGFEPLSSPLIGIGYSRSAFCWMSRTGASR